MNGSRRTWQAIGDSLGRIGLGIIITVVGLFFIDVLIYLGTLDETYNKLVAAAFNEGSDSGFEETYHTAHRNGYTSAYEQGYQKGYEIGQTSNSANSIPALVALKNPSYQELKGFLSRDQTDAREYLPDEFISFDFAVELNNNAEQQGIRAAFVTIVFPEKSHGITAFETSDRGLVFIEPQSDATVYLTIGESYWKLAGITDPSLYDDTIVGIELIW